MYFDRRDRVGSDVVKRNRAAVGVNDALAVRRGKTNVILVLVRVPSQLAAVQRARINIADALVIRQEVNAIADPHRPARITVGQREPREDAAAHRIDPNLAGGTAAITLPSRRVGGVASNNHSPVRPGSERAGVPQIQLARRTPVARDRKGTRFALIPSSGVGAEINFAAVLAPADSLREGGAEEREAARFAAARRHHVELGITLIRRDKSNPRAVGREPRKRTTAETDRQSYAVAAARRDAPKIVLANVDDAVARYRRIAVISLIHKANLGERLCGFPWGLAIAVCRVRAVAELRRPSNAKAARASRRARPHFQSG